PEGGVLALKEPKGSAPLSPAIGIFQRPSAALGRRIIIAVYNQAGTVGWCPPCRHDVKLPAAEADSDSARSAVRSSTLPWGDERMTPLARLLSRASRIIP